MIMNKLDAYTIYQVQIIQADTGEVIKTIDCPTYRQAERVESGVNINLKHEEFYTQIEEIQVDPNADPQAAVAAVVESVEETPAATDEETKEE